MNTYTKEQRLSAFKNISPSSKSFLFSDEIIALFEGISKKYSLIEDQSRNLSDESGLVILGLTKPNEFVPNLVERTKLAQDVVMKIAQDVNNQIFSKKDSYVSKEEGGVEEKKIEVQVQKPQTTSESFLPQLSKKPEVPINLPTQSTVPGFIPVGFKPVPPTTPAVPPSIPVPVAPTPKTPAAAPSMLDAKLSQSMNVPLQNSEVKTKPQADPYREPIE